MNEQEVKTLMERSQSEKDWSDNCNIVKDACGGYPDFWWGAIIQSGLGRTVMARWGASPEIHIEVIGKRDGS